MIEENILQGTVAILFLLFIKEFFSYLKSKKDNKGNGNITKLIQNLETNHLSEINLKLEKVDDKLDRVINILIEIKEKIKK